MWPVQNRPDPIQRAEQTGCDPPYVTGRLSPLLWSTTLGLLYRNEESTRFISLHMSRGKIVFLLARGLQLSKYSGITGCWLHKNVQFPEDKFGTPRPPLYSVFSLTWQASIEICWNKRKRLHKKRGSVWDTKMTAVTSYENTLWRMWCPVKTVIMKHGLRTADWI